MLLFGSTIATCLLVVVVSVLFLVKPWVVYPHCDPAVCGAGHGFGGSGHGWNHYGQIPMFFGTFAALICAALAVTFVVIMRRLWRSGVSISFPEAVYRQLDDTETVAMPLEPFTQRERLPLLYTLVAVLGLALGATFFFSPAMADPPQKFWPSKSDEAITNVRLSHRFNAKVFEDTVVFHVVLLGLAAAGVLAHLVPRVRAVLHHRVRVPGNARSPLHPFPFGVTVGELAVIAAIVMLFVYWLYYWRYKYKRLRIEASPDVHAQAQVWARVMGHMSNLSFSLLLLPAARNSMWVACFGIPFERAVKYHRGMGFVAYVCVTVHMVIWLGKWGVEGTLGNNLTQIANLKTMLPTVRIVNGTCTGVAPHWDDFTIVLSWIGWVFLTVMVAIAVQCRRRNYELFHYVHHFAWVYYVIALLHAWAFWFFASGGLTLYVVDRCIRLVRRATATHVVPVSLEFHDGVSLLRLPADTLSYYAGQYAFICVPAVSQSEWHPFTISSAPSSTEMSFHIKDVGPRTWTDRLAELAKAHTVVEVRVDGPYGYPGAISDKRCLLLIAGGIGVTPLHSIFAELHLRALHSKDDVHPLESVTLVWSARSDDLFALFSPTLLSVMRHNPGDIFHFQLHNSQPARSKSIELRVGELPSDISQDAKSLIQRCRPNLDLLFEQASQHYVPSDVAVMVCGPAELTYDASERAFRYGFHFHNEVFHF
jgi:predicted ferric reductase